MGQRRQKTQALLTSPCLPCPSIIRKQSCYLTKGTALRSHLSHLSSPIREGMTDGLLSWLLLHPYLLFTLSFFLLIFIFGYAGSLLLHKLSLVGLPFPSPRDVPDPGIKPVSPALAGGFFTTEPPGKPQRSVMWLPLNLTPRRGEGWPERSWRLLCPSLP